ncbi:aliphatic sulfonate ABC transporter substrate-binding protein [Paenibacillus sp. YPG26]|uniref:aliphatic sulfonate ABC transporter substrate-binding protein n=1 Tax=Paenibacillus sp. YPG26 TaxID=2878915 RepID=UPI00203AD65C|nr:aliphatic sulfonate ABC transporter substrate-binding protein [Paenibacillus sp. YPG26]USB33165.1 aliphatic sulfonate ABC transporter substrate-binding protein [Paenibacillus sp. YPG26]
MNTKSTRQPKITVLLMAMITALILSACNSTGSTSNGASNSSSSKKEATVNIAINGGLNLLTIAKQKGWFEEEFSKVNAKVQWHEFQSSVPLLEGLVSGRVDFSFIGDGTVVTGKSAKMPFTVISTTGVQGNQNSVIVKPDSPIKSIADLKGKTIAVAKGSSGHIFLIKALQKNNMAEADVKLVDLQPGEGNPAFQTGKVDAWAIWDPFVTTEVQAKRARIVESVDSLGIVAPAVMIGRDEFIKNNPDLTSAYLKVYEKTVKWVNANKDEAAAILAKEKKMELELVKTLVNRTEYINTPVTGEVQAAMQSTADVLLKSGTIREAVDISKVFDNSYIEKALK